MGSTTNPQRLSLEAALEQFQRIQTLQPSRAWRLVIRKYNPGGMTAHQTTEIKAAYAGIDWEAGRIVLEPVTPMTELSPEQVEAIAKSVREGTSWHAMERERKLRERISRLEQELAQLRGQGAGANEQA